MRDVRILFGVLICSKRHRLNESLEDLHTGQLAAVLKEQGYSTAIVNIGCDEDAKLRRIMAYRPEVVCLGSFASHVIPFSVHVERILSFAQRIKQSMPNVHLVCSGYAATHAWETLLDQKTAVDSVIRGEGEKGISELVQRVRQGQSLKGCQGVYYKDVMGIQRNAESPIIHDLDALPFVERDVLKESSFQFARVRTSRGCVGACSFCENAAARALGGPAWRGRSPTKVVDELAHLVHECNTRAFFIMDSAFEDPGNAGKERIRRIAEEILRRHLRITFCAYFRAESFATPEDEELLRLLVRAGLEEGYVGLEAGNRPALVLYNKRATVEDNYRVVDIFRRNGVYLMAGFIMYQPYASLAELRENAEFLHATRLGHVFQHFVRPLYVYPGTAIARKLADDGLLQSTSSDPGEYMRYQYVDERVSTLANEMERIFQEEQLEGECFDLRISILLSRIRRFCRLCDDMDVAYQKLIDRVDELRERLNERCYQFYTRALDLCESGWDRAQFDRYAVECVPELRNGTSEMQTMYSAFAKQCLRKGIVLRDIEGRCVSA